MLRGAALIARKDIGLLLFRGQGMVQALLLGLLLIFLFSLAGSRSQVEPVWQAAIFWLATCFSLVLIFNSLYAVEEETGARDALLMAPVPAQAIWLGKAWAGVALLLLVQLFFLPAEAVFLQASLPGSWTDGLILLLSVDGGLVILSSLFGAMGQGQSARESLLSVILFPLQIPLLLAGIEVGQALLSQGYGGQEMGVWLGLILAFDAVFLGAGLLLFPFVYAE